MKAWSGTEVVISGLRVLLFTPLGELSWWYVRSPLYQSQCRQLCDCVVWRQTRALRWTPWGTCGRPAFTHGEMAHCRRRFARQTGRERALLYSIFPLAYTRWYLIGKRDPVVYRIPGGLGAAPFQYSSSNSACKYARSISSALNWKYIQMKKGNGNGNLQWERTIEVGLGNM